MKRIIFFMLMTAFSTSMLFAQVPEKIQTTFKEKYPEVTMVKWENDPNGYQVWFVDKDHAKNRVLFSTDGRIVRREVEMADVKNYPQPMVEYYTKNYPNDKERQVWMVVDENGNKIYFLSRDDQYVYFDKDGKFTRVEKREIKKEMQDNN